MRIRAFGQYLHVSIAALVVFESLLLFGFFLGSVAIREPAPFGTLLATRWLDGALFSSIIAVSLLAFGLYNSRHRREDAHHDAADPGALA